MLAALQPDDCVLQLQRKAAKRRRGSSSSAGEEENKQPPTIRPHAIKEARLRRVRERGLSRELRLRLPALGGGGFADVGGRVHARLDSPERRIAERLAALKRM